jgi:sialate O-acetylesterase
MTLFPTANRIAHRTGLLKLDIRTVTRVLIISLIGSGVANAEIVPASLFSDNAIIQADREVPVWGWDNPGQDVTVTLGAAKVTGKADQDGRWQVTLPLMKASGTPMDMTMAGSSTVTAKNVMVGEVWVDSGQSNMEYPLRWGLTKVPEFDKAAADANYPNFRTFKVEQRMAGEPPPRDVKGKWEVATPQTVGQWSAAGFFFGRDLQQQLGGTPVGLIDSTVGGTQIVAWIPPMVYKDTHATTHPWEQQQWAQSQKQMADYYAAADAAKAAGQPAPTAPKGARWPGCLYDGMVAPLMPYAIRGIVWYQGESNTYVKDPDGYGKMLQGLVTDWRAAWNRPNVPFIIVQLPNYSEDLSSGKKAAYAGPDTKIVQADPVELNSQWPPIREVQRRTAEMLPNTALVVTIDIGTQLMIHPWDKWDLGQRLALTAMTLAYGKKDLVSSGPLPAKVQFQNGAAIVKFKSIGGGLDVKGGGDLQGFALAGSDGKFSWAKGAINGDTVTLTSDEVKDPVEVRYDWAENPIGNLINKDGLPASPFKLTTADAGGK